MEAILFTAALIVLMGIALIVLGRSWPRSSRLGGYRVRPGAGSAGSAARDQEQDVAIREDDDARWRWDEPGDDEAPRP